MTAARPRRPETGLTIELMIECSDEAVAAALNEALMPDNTFLPKGPAIPGVEGGCVVRFDVGSPRARPALSTVSSIISDAKLFRRRLGRGQDSRARSSAPR